MGHLMSDLQFRAATRADLPALVAMLAADPLGQQRERFEDPLPPCYLAAEAIDADPRHLLLIAHEQGPPLAMLQLSLLPYLTYQGRSRALVEGVRVLGARRGEGIGEALLREGMKLHL